MSPDNKILSALKKNAQKLNESSDDLNRLIEDFEKELAALNIGVVYWSDEHTYQEDIIEEEDGETAEQVVWGFGYCKVGDAWRIVTRRCCLRLRKEHNGYGPEWCTDGFVFVDDPMPLADAPRIIRVESASKLNDLMIGLNKKLANYIKSIEDAIHAF